MCGRFTLRTEPAEFWPAEQLSLFQPRYNIAPTQLAPAVRRAEAKNQPTMLRWGLVPPWSPDTKIGSRMINARGETVSEKPAFREAFKRRRCLVIADGYYEWKTSGKVKQPFYIHMSDEQPFAFAALWESWNGPPGARLETPLESCTIITTESNELTSALHDRMPVIIPSEQQAMWLDPGFSAVSALSELLRPFSSDEMAVYPVSRFVNKATNESPECLERIDL